mmetsp:Transcript_76262/g.177003  ORF Transcript_76262/g.177003 Transcript_76262/m.177003 type:complete len:207 (+) Transcript_76262:934-1554(+)
MGRWNAHTVIVGLHLLVTGDAGAEESVHCLLHGWNRNQLLSSVPVPYTATDTVIEGNPFGELVDIIPDALILRVEEVRAVLAGTDAIGCDIVVAIAAQVFTLVDDEGRQAQLLRTALCQHAAGQAGTDDEKIDLLRARCEIAAKDVNTEIQRGIREVATAMDRILAALACDSVKVAIGRRSAEGEWACAPCRYRARHEQGSKPAMA